MKFFHIDTKIDKELLNRFLDFCNLNADEDWTVVIYSVGGYMTMAKNILYIINQRKEKVTLICNEAYSAAFYILYEAKCKKCICENAKGMIHLHSAEMFMQPNGKPAYYEDECIIKNWNERKKEDSDWVKEYLTKKEFEKYKKGKDIYFTFKRMKEIFPNAEVI